MASTQRERSMSTLVYVVYGQTPHADEVVYAILSARNALDRHDEDCRIVLYTDDAAAFRGLPVQLEVRSRAVFAEWMGPLGFYHRSKIFVIKDALQNCDDRVVYCDSDTYFLKSPNELFAQIRSGTSFMHVCEGYLSEFNGAGLSDFLDSSELHTVAGRRWHLMADTLMFNAGVIGMHRDDIDLLDEVACLTDQIYPYVKIHTVEQFAFSACLCSRIRLLEAYDFVCHYWPMPGRALFRAERRRALHDPSVTSDEARWERLAPHRPVPSIAHFRPTVNERIRSILKRKAKRAGVLDQVRLVLDKVRGNHAA